MHISMFFIYIYIDILSNYIILLNISRLIKIEQYLNYIDTDMYTLCTREIHGMDLDPLSSLKRCGSHVKGTHW